MTRKDLENVFPEKIIPVTEEEDAVETVSEENAKAGGELTAPEAASMAVPSAVAAAVTEIMRPILESIGTLLKNNTEAMEQIATSQDVIRNRMEALEKQVRLQTPVTDRQAKYLADKARDRARSLLDKKGIDERKAVTKLAGIIKKDVIARYGVGSLREIPRCEYNVAMGQMETWMNGLAVLDIAREARKRAEAEKGQGDKA